MNGEPHCPCVMTQCNLPRSAEHLRKQVESSEAIKRVFDKPVVDVPAEVKHFLNKPEALNDYCRRDDAFLRTLWEVCNGFGTTGECIWIVMKYKLKESK
jgi:hypothetical protein